MKNENKKQISKERIYLYIYICIYLENISYHKIKFQKNKTKQHKQISVWSRRQEAALVTTTATIIEKVSEKHGTSKHQQNNTGEVTRR